MTLTKTALVDVFTEPAEEGLPLTKPDFLEHSLTVTNSYSGHYVEGNAQ